MTTETMATLTLTDGQTKNLAAMAAAAKAGGRAQAAIHADLDRLTADVVKSSDKANVVDAYSTAARAFLKAAVKAPGDLKLALAALSTALTRYRRRHNLPAKRAPGAGRKSKEESTEAGKAETVNLADLSPAEHVNEALAALLTGLARLGPSERADAIKRISAMLKQVPTK